MDIIIRNGIIQTEEATRIQNIKNEEGLLKKDYSNYIRGQIGPYYDFLECHLHVPRFPKDIPNFHGPQNSKKIKMDFHDYKKNNKFCCICHEYINWIPSSTVKKTFFESIIADEYKYPIKIIFNNDKKVIIKRYFNLFTIITRYIHKTNSEDIRQQADSYKRTSLKIISLYYKIIYKVLYKPVMYPISLTETKLVWPWELTNYQKMRMKYPNYKKSIIFTDDTFDKFQTNYIIID